MTLGAIVLLVLTASIGHAATPGRYTGTTGQRQGITFSVSGHSVAGISVKLDDICPDGHTLRVTIGSGYFPALPIDNSGRFSATVHPPNAPDQPTTITGRITGTTANGSIADTTISQQELALCHGKTTFTASAIPAPAGADQRCQDVYYRYRDHGTSQYVQASAIRVQDLSCSRGRRLARDYGHSYQINKGFRQLDGGSRHLDGFTCRWIHLGSDVGIGRCRAGHSFTSFDVYDSSPYH
jgi:hypothetical protein